MFRLVISNNRNNFKNFCPNLMRIRMESGKSKKGSPKQSVECKRDQAVDETAMPKVCSNVAARQGRTIPEFDKCMDDHFGHKTPSCTTKLIEQFPCKVYKSQKYGGVQPNFISKSAWENPPCCKTEINCSQMRHDVLFLKPKSDFTVQRTWCEFPERIIKVTVPKCKAEKVIFPPMERRERGQVNKAATKSQPPVDLKSKCPKIGMPGCKQVRSNLACRPSRNIKCCRKRCTQYPSFSECCFKRPPPKRNSECRCLASVGMCQIYWPNLYKNMWY